jgi:hypothetical protein
MPEFGTPQGFQPSGLGSRPAIFVSAQNEAGVPAVATSDVVPDGETWVLQGADFGVAVTPAIVPQWMYGYVFTATSAIPYVASADLSGSRRWNGTSWRGSVPFTPGQRIQVETDADGLPSYSACWAWGIILPYVAL